MTMQGVYTKRVVMNGTTSSAVNTEGGVLVGVYTPSGLTSTVLYVDASNDDGATFFNAYDNTGTRISATVAASRYVTLPQSSLVFGADQVRIISGSSDTDKVLTLVFQKVA